MIRLFVGLELPPDLAQRLEGLGGGIPNARWVEARNLHVTLRFIGEVDEGLAAEIDDALAQLHAPAFTLTLDGFGTFGRAKPNHLWAAVEKAPALLHLQAKVEAALARLGLVPEGRKYLPHVTLARFKDPPVSRVQDFIARNSPFHAGPWQVDHFVLFVSRLGRSGAEYEAVADYPLN
ncbi:MAG: RNA 2',3'-cyclic phosphodiesterase [Bacteroidales bacterium]